MRAGRGISRANRFGKVMHSLFTHIIVDRLQLITREQFTDFIRLS